MYTGNMIILIHIAIALSSLVYTTYVLFSPTAKKLQASYVLVGLTLATGTALVIRNPSHLMQSCTMGLLYVGIVTVGIVSAHKKLESEATS